LIQERRREEDVKASRTLASVIVLAVALGAMACSSSNGGTTKTTPATNASKTKAAQTPTGGNAQSQVTVTLVEYQVKPVVPSVPAGQVKFSAQNIGSTDHELRVFKTDLDATALPTNDDGSVNEGGPGIALVEKIGAMKANSGDSVTGNLTPGNYVLVCNIVQTTNGQTVSHYNKGMAVKFTITQ
jgi:hypothetical protein